MISVHGREIHTDTSLQGCWRVVYRKCSQKREKIWDITVSVECWQNYNTFFNKSTTLNWALYVFLYDQRRGGNVIWEIKIQQFLLTRNRVSKVAQKFEIEICIFNFLCGFVKFNLLAVFLSSNNVTLLVISHKKSAFTCTRDFGLQNIERGSWARGRKDISQMLIAAYCNCVRTIWYHRMRNSREKNYQHPLTSFTAVSTKKPSLLLLLFLFMPSISTVIAFATCTLR